MSEKKPNILFILTDDQGAWALHCAGAWELRTPNLDRLAAEGIRFDNFFCASPVCSPARASILTGRIPSQHGVHDFLYWSRTVPDCHAEDIRFLEGQTSYVDILFQHGYDAFLSGKWHLGYAMEPQCGYADWSALPAGGCPYYQPMMAEDGKMVDYSGRYSSDLFTDNALAYLDEKWQRDKPFCLHVHFTAPHSPWEREHHPKELWDGYHALGEFESVPDDPLPDGYNANRKNERERRAALAGYFAAITAMDANVGRLLDWLETNGERENTLVVFMSDNGMNMGHHGIYGKGNGSWPQNMFDTSVKVPCIISRPGHVPEARLDSRLLSQYDWLPTALDYVGLGDQIPGGLPGESFAAVLRGETGREREKVVVFDEYGPVRMIRSHEWKLVWRYPVGPHELYHLANDPQEKVNLFDRKGNLERIHAMRHELDAWFGKYVSPRLDGTHLEVTGRGQKDLADRAGAFLVRFPDEWLAENPETAQEEVEETSSDFSGHQAIESARPVWAEGRENEMNLYLGFRAVFDVPAGEGVRITLKLTASTLYRAFVNGNFVGYGPARAGKDYYRVDEWDITPHLRPGRNVAAIEVAGYCVNSYYTFDSAAFLQAALVTGSGNVIASTAGDGGVFEATVLTERVQKVPRYSFQRPFCEVYALEPGWDAWRSDPGADFSSIPLAVQSAHPLLTRRVPYPDFEVLQAIAQVAKGTVRPAEGPVDLWKDRALTNIGPELGGYSIPELALIPQHEVQRLESRMVDTIASPLTGDAKHSFQEGEFIIFDLGRNISGFPRFSVSCEGPVRLFASFDEILTGGDVDFKRLSCVNVLTCDLAPGEYALEAFEAYTLRYLKIIVAEGAFTIQDVGIRTCENPDTKSAIFKCSDSRLEEIFEAARHTFAQNAVDVLMDCPHRERAGWLCDSYFTARAEQHFSGATAVEYNFLENYALPERFDHLPEGMLPMCYPADHINGRFIPNWALWLVVQLEDYAGRGGDTALIAQLKPKVLALFDYFAPFENSDGLLEKLDSWVFVEWSKANAFVQDVNYPSNMLYAGALSAAAVLYGLPELAGKAEAIRETIRRQSFDGEFFIDNALRKEDGTLEITQNHTEVCQYFAFFFDVATPETHGELQRRLVHEFGPGRMEAGACPEVHPANMFIGHMVRLELLSRWNEQEKVMQSLLGYLHHMAEKTGTLWENDGASASLNHGFASHAAVSLHRDVLGLREVDVVNKKICAYIPDLPLDWCAGEMPVPGGIVTLRWEKMDGAVRATLEAPAGYETEITSALPLR